MAMNGCPWCSPTSKTATMCAVAQPRDRPRFAGETRTQILVARLLQQLDGDLAFEEGIPGEQKLAHAALTDPVDDFKAPDSVRQSVHYRSG